MKRLDFLIDRDRNWWFLEVNPNGQYALLDLHGNDGLRTGSSVALRRFDSWRTADGHALGLFESGF